MTLAGLETLTFDVSNNDHNEEAVVVGVVSMVDTRCDLTDTDDFLQGHQHQLDGQESHALIEEIERAVKDKIPERDRRDAGSGACRYCASQKYSSKTIKL